MKKILRYFITAAVWLVIWQVVSMLTGTELLLPSPVNTAEAFIRLASTAEFYKSVGSSILRILIGYAAGIIIGAMMGGMTAFSENADSFFSPLLYIIRATPVASFIILAIVWLSSSYVPSFISMLIVIPFVWSNVKTGISNTDKALIEMADAFGAGFIDKAVKIYIPSVKPYFLSAVSTAMGLAWKAGIAAEVICYPPLSIGKGIYNSKVYFATPELFAWTVTVIVLSIILEKLILLTVRKKSDDKA